MAGLSRFAFRILTFPALPWVSLAAGIGVSIWLGWPLLSNADNDTQYGIRMVAVGSAMALLLSLALRVLRDQTIAARRAMESAQLGYLNSEDNMRAIFESSVDGIVIINCLGIVQQFNAAAERLFGYAASEVIGRNVSMLMPSPHRGQHDAYMQRYLAGGEARIIGIGREVEGQRKDGSVFPIWLAVSEARRDGQAPRFIGIAHDITEKSRTMMLRHRANELEQIVQLRTAELRTAKEAVEAANHTKSDFLAGVTHELRTPLHAILSYSSLGLEKLQEASPERLCQYLERIAKAGQRMLELVNDLLDISKLEAGKMVFSFAPYDLQQIAAEVAAELDTMAAGKSVAMEIVPPSCPVIVSCDAHRIGQVLRNLLANAIRFSPENETVKVLFNKEAHSMGQVDNDGEAQPVLTVSVLDCGPGIPAEERKHIFEPYTQSQKNVAQGKGGTGLGLAICRQIVGAHQGRIWAEENPAGGAKVSFALPGLIKGRVADE